MKTNEDTVKDDFVNPKESVGEFHNEALQYVLENTTEVPDSNEIKSHVEQILNQKYDSISLASLPDFPDNYDSLDLYVWLDSFNVSTALKFEASKTFTLFESQPELSALIDSIETREVEASSLFEGIELDLYYEHLAVAKHTAIFWYPEEQGGMNGIQFLGVQNYKSTNAVNWWKVFGVDVIGGWVGGPPGYVGASAIAVIMQL